MTIPHTAAADEINATHALFDAERHALQQRRAQVLGPEAASNSDELRLPRVGLALSGGGVRSATFALGLLRGLAQSKSANHPGHQAPDKRSLVTDGLLGRIDYLSSVSGGGYTAGMWGRLIQRHGANEAQAQLAQSDSPALQWLRRYGRYLTPAGSRDIGMAVVTYMRALLAIHFEFMFACMLLGLVVIAPHVWQHSTQVLQVKGWEPWMTVWWTTAALLWLACGPGLITGYWAARDGPDAASATSTEGLASASKKRVPVRDVLLVFVMAGVALVLLQTAHTQGTFNIVQNGLTWPTAAVVALISSVIGQVAAQAWLATQQDAWSLAVARVRNVLTRSLRVVSLCALALAGLGLLDLASWWLMQEFQAKQSWLWGGAGAGGVALLLLRSLMQPLQQMAAETGNRASQWLPRLLNLASILGLVVLVLLWLALLQWFVFELDTFAVFVGVPAWMRAAVVLVVWLLWMLLTASNAQMANTSSLHSFYRARLTRAYLAVGNPNRVLKGAAFDAASSSQREANVTAVVDGDDARLSHYQPEKHGGPIHLVNTCLNQTRDGKSGLYNADRKGASVTATWRGIEVGRDGFMPAHDSYDAGTLGRWVAVSGAAASPGAGSYTSRGLALLIYFLGVRLGLWVRAPKEQVQLKWLSRFAWRCLPKPLMLSSEASATFFGVERPWWYLSDGGHFENTAVYALLKRELDFIILSDGSCDVDYKFGDIENLVRKARIDFGAEIDFYTREEAADLFSLAGTELTVVSPEDMANNHSCRGVLLARIRYRERIDSVSGRPVRPEGTLLVVKPNLHDELNVDVLAYAQKNPAFPHESTGDQSFDEAQWESYHRLGEDFGRAMHDSWLAQLPGWSRPARHALKVAARLRHATESMDAAKTNTEPLWRRSARATAIGTTLGLGASGTLLLSLWQVQDQVQRRQNDEQIEVRQMLLDTSKGLQGLDGACPNVPDHVVAQTSRLLDLRGSPALRPLEKGGLDLVVARLNRECFKAAAPGSECQAAEQRLTNDLCTKLNKDPEQQTTLDYWHPRTTPENQSAEARKTLHQLNAQLASLWGGKDQRVVTTASAPATSDPGQTDGTAMTATPTVTPGASGTPVPAGVDVVAASAQGTPPAASGLAAPTRAVSLAARTLTDACKRDLPSERTILYVQVYDETSLRVANQWRQVLLDLPGGVGLQLAPIENVSRSAEVRQQRRPAPWPKPTFLLHDPSSRRCAEVLVGLLQPRLTQTPAEGSANSAAEKKSTPAGGDQVWIRNLPDSQPNRRIGVIELWLPPTSLSESKVASRLVSSAELKVSDR
ncbi:MAG: hypothetical protein RIS44_987 [Pseudomonadota bacterium]